VLKLWTVISFCLALVYIHCTKVRDNPLDPANANVTDLFGLTTDPDSTSILITWNALDHPGVVGYRLYSLRIPEVQFGLLTELTNIEHAYRDTSVLFGNTYVYVIAAINNDGDESIRSLPDSVSYFPNPQLTFSPESLSFSAFRGGLLPGSQTLVIGSTSGQINWTLDIVNGQWLTASPTSGTGSNTPVTVSVTATSFVEDTLQAILQITAVEDSVTVPIKLAIRDLFISGSEILIAPSEDIANLRASYISDDINIDLIYIFPYFHDIRIIFGNGDGTFSGGSDILNAYYPFECADMNGSGPEDVIAVNSNGNRLVFYLNDGNGEFPSSFSYGIVDSGYIASIAPIDILNDGDMDLAVLYYDQSIPTYYVLFLDNIANLYDIQPWDSIEISGHGRLHAVNLNGDSFPDLAIESNTGDIELILSLGNGHYNSSSVNSSPLSNLQGISAFNCDLDTDDDFAICYSDTFLGIADNLGNGALNFEIFPLSSDLTDGLGITTDDFNLDGIPDAASVHGVRNVAIHPGINPCAFGQPMIFYAYDSGNITDEIIASDFDNDGDPDLAVLSFSFTAIKILLNNAIP
jgi:hypothetical protein